MGDYPPPGHLRRWLAAARSARTARKAAAGLKCGQPRQVWRERASADSVHILIEKALAPGAASHGARPAPVNHVTEGAAFSPCATAVAGL
ncbi:MAG TPA: hypothetical protein DEA40_08920 [Parvularcula sp.]|nr:hypothetical protein [Parvularcula sp.]HBS34442.1 hypothetical protein [Parvularcula sp.]